MQSLFTIVCVLLLLSYSCNAQKQKLTLAGFFPHSGGWPVGGDVQPGAALAFTDINADDELLPNYELVPALFDTQCDAGLGLNLLVELDRNNTQEAPLVGLVGAGCSVVSTPVNLLASEWKLPQISWGSTSPVLSDSQTYPYFLRTCAPDTNQAEAWLGFVLEMQWTRVALLHGAQELHTLLADSFKESAEQVGIEVLASQSFLPDEKPTAQIQAIKDSGANIILLACYADQARRAYVEAMEAGIVGGKFVWVGTDSWALDFWKYDTVANPEIDTDTSAADDEDIREAAQGTIAFNTLGDAGSSYGDFAVKYRQARGFDDSEELSVWPGFAYDATYVFARGLHQLLEVEKKPLTSPTFGEELLTHMAEETSFEGVTGELQFDANGDRIIAYQVQNLQGEKWERVAVYSSIAEDSYVQSKDIIWMDGTTTLPVDELDPPVPQQAQDLTWVYVLVGVLGGLLLLSILGFVAYTLYQRAEYKKQLNVAYKEKTLHIKVRREGRTRFFEPDDEEVEEVEVERANLVFSKTDINFRSAHLKAQDTAMEDMADVRFPLNELFKEQVTVFNDTKKTKIFNIYGPQDEQAYKLVFQPARGLVRPDEQIQISVEIEFLCTTSVDVFCAFEIEKEGYVLLHIKADAEETTSLDWDLLEVGEVVGEGAGSVVHKGKYRGDVVAIKKLKLQELTDQMYKDFKNEVMIMVKLNYTNYIVHFVGACHQKGHMCLVAEFMPYGSLSGHIHGDTNLPFVYKLKAAHDGAQAMRVLHANNVLHRDLKPDNFLCQSLDHTDSIVVKLSDFGSSRLAEAMRGHTVAVGTPAYMAPEQLASGKSSTKSDVYSFAIILWEMVSGAEPWAELVHVWDIPQRVISGERPDMPENLPTDYVGLIKRGWSEKREKRPSFGYLAKALMRQYRSAVKAGGDGMDMSSHTFDAESTTGASSSKVHESATDESTEPVKAATANKKKKRKARK